MSIIEENIRSQLEEVFGEMKENITLMFFSGDKCIYCKEIEEILNTISEVSKGKVKLEKYDFKKDKNIAEKFKVKMYPAIVLNKKGKYTNIKYYGIPSGYEFQSLIEDILDISKEEVTLPDTIKDKIKSINKDIEILVFVTPMCPYCPRAVRSSHKYAMINPNIQAYCIEAMEFEELSRKYNVMAVPKVVIRVNGEDKVEFEGAYPDVAFVNKIYESIK